MLVSLTIVKYRKRFIPLALLSMAIFRIPLLINKSCRFWKLLGTGRGGSFDLNPDWQHWGLLATWENRADFEIFNTTSLIKKWWATFTTEQWTILCEPISGHGKWDNQEPFKYTGNQEEYTGPVAVLTRATIRISRLKNFWSHVKPVARIMKNAPGYITSVGIGEAPVYRQATFSIWRSLSDLKVFAYHSEEHKQVINKTRNENWYSEELFARFKPVYSTGLLNGKNPLENII
ncbi:DUF3291 domain-containing protein [Rubrolithibacter danxiaensis]|uniref:DUF3291 domain-containing protein n=1 Tax=Rubrolithibacter danxiaensis TaxID=3390805 RepID=UPI003BF8DAF7